MHTDVIQSPVSGRPVISIGIPFNNENIASNVKFRHNISIYDGLDSLNYASTNEALDTGKSVVSWEASVDDGKLQVTPLPNGSIILDEADITYQMQRYGRK